MKTNYVGDGQRDGLGRFRSRSLTHSLSLSSGNWDPGAGCADDGTGGGRFTVLRGKCMATRLR